MSDVPSRSHGPTASKVAIGLLRLTDSAPVIVAHEFGFFADERLDVALSIEPSWANIADKLAYGALDATVVVPPLAFAVSLGLRGPAEPLIIPFAISLGGNTITLGAASPRNSGPTPARRALPPRSRRGSKDGAQSRPSPEGGALRAGRRGPGLDPRPRPRRRLHERSPERLARRLWRALRGHDRCGLRRAGRGLKAARSVRTRRAGRLFLLCDAQDLVTRAISRAPEGRDLTANRLMFQETPLGTRLAPPTTAAPLQARLDRAPTTAPVKTDGGAVLIDPRANDGSSPDKGPAALERAGIESLIQ